MTAIKQKIIPYLWFDKQAKEAAWFYTSVFRDSRIKNISSLHDNPSGNVEVVSFELFGQEFMAISAGPFFHFNESITFIVKSDTQEEIDYYWERLTSEGGQEFQHRVVQGFDGILLYHRRIGILEIWKRGDIMMAASGTWPCLFIPAEK